MPENTNEEPLDHSPNTQSENPPDEIIPTIDTKTINLNQETENMEAHHHEDPHHKTKKWKEYFLEFLMIFLAVFLSFIAENIRERVGENDRAKEYGISLVQDLQNDTTSINVQVKQGESYIAITDSLLNLSNARLEDRNAAKFSFFTRFMYWTAPLTWNRATFEQIKNSGSLRYFKNYLLLEKLMKYNGQINELEGEYDNHRTRGNMLLSQINEIIDPGIHHELSKYILLSLDTMSKQTIETFLLLKTEPLENKRKEISEMLNMGVVQQRNLSLTNTRLLQAKKLATELISDLKKEYKIE